MLPIKSVFGPENSSPAESAGAGAGAEASALSGGAMSASLAAAISSRREVSSRRSEASSKRSSATSSTRGPATIALGTCDAWCLDSKLLSARILRRVLASARLWRKRLVIADERASGGVASATAGAVGMAADRLI